MKYSINFVGDTAVRVFETSGPRHIVMAAGSKAAYLRSDSGDIVGVGSADVQPHTRFILGDIPLAEFFVGMQAQLIDHQLVFENGVRLDLSNAYNGHKKSCRRSPILYLHQLACQVNATLKVAISNLEPVGLGKFLPLLLSDFEGMNDLILPQNSDSFLIAAALEPVQKVMVACRKGKLSLAISEAKGLLGLGPGLTPSGDDFVGGLLFGIRHLSDAYPSNFCWDGAGAKNLIDRSATETNLISHAFLKDFACGQGPASLHNLMDGLLLGAELSEAKLHLLRVAEIGHSSGIDMLTGLLTSMTGVTKFQFAKD